MNWQAVIDGSWPAAQVVRRDGWTLRISPGAGSRVNALSGSGKITDAETLAREYGVAPNFVIWPGHDQLDADLSAMGYDTADAVNIWQTDSRTLAGGRMPHATAFAVWPPLAIMRDLWQSGDIGPERQAVMERAPVGTGILGRVDDRAAGVGFISIHEDVAMLHALHVDPAHRRKGVARHIMRAAAHWAAANGGDTFTLIVTRENPANTLYAALGMTQAAGYHYRRAA